MYYLTLLKRQYYNNLKPLIQKLKNGLFGKVAITISLKGIACNILTIKE